MSAVRIECPFFAPVPVGHRVTVLGVEAFNKPLFGGAGAWEQIPYFVVLDETTRVVYADAMSRLHPEASFEQLRFHDDTYRVSQTQAPLRGQVVSTVAVSDHGDSIYFRTRLAIVPDGPIQRF